MWNPCLFRSSLHVYVVYFEWKTFQDRSSSLPRFRWNITKLKSIRMANHGCRVYESYYTVRSLTLRPVKERKKTNMSWPPSWPFTGRFHLALAKQFEKGNISRGHSGDLPRMTADQNACITSIALRSAEIRFFPPKRSNEIAVDGRCG